MNKIEIADPVKKKTTKCEHNFSCLSGDSSCLCEVIDETKLPTVKLKSKPEPPCPYCISLNTNHYCLCPTRNAIYKKYKQ